MMSVPRRTTSPSPEACCICNRIYALFSAPAEAFMEEMLGGLADLLQGDCVHVGLFKNFRERWADYCRCNNVADDWSHPVVRAMRFRSLEGLRLHIDLPSDVLDDVSTRFIPFVCKLIHRDDIPGHPGTSLMVNQQWINLDLLRRRIAYCDTHHGHMCRRHILPREEDKIKPRFLVDTHRGCLVNGQEICSDYVALSYQWGQAYNLRNNTQLCDSFLVADTFATEPNVSKIPQTIKDAFAVVKLLGYRYLWVDSLCIVQDDQHQLKSELAQMHRIYNSATLTIIAVDGVDANYGLRGFADTTAPRNIKRTYARLSNSETLVKDQYIIDEENHVMTKYHNRAWTFQEEHMSNRAILFRNQSVEWKCRFVSQGEDEPLQHNTSVTQEAFSLLNYTAIPTLGGLNGIVGSYNRRELSFPEDAFSAFAGVQSLLERRYQGRFLYGMPEFWFDIALNWAPSVDCLTRRVSSALHRSFQQPYQLPSWSWIGWAGYLDFPFDAALERSARGYHSCFTEPVTRWYTMSDPTSTDRRKIGSGWYDYRLSARSSSSILPDGWNRIWENEGDPEGESEDPHWPKPDFLLEQRYYFRRDKELPSKYWYPFPTSESHKDDRKTPSLQTAYLYARTGHAYLSGQMMSETLKTAYGRFEFGTRIWLTRQSGQHVGSLMLHNKEETEATGCSDSLRLVELVATCKGYSADIGVVGEDWDVSTDKDLMFELFSTRRPCYFVLWIEWIDGIAYRKASGAVAAEVWEQEVEKEPVDLILG